MNEGCEITHRAWCRAGCFWKQAQAFPELTRRGGWAGGGPSPERRALGLGRVGPDPAGAGYLPSPGQFQGMFAAALWPGAESLVGRLRGQASLSALVLLLSASKISTHQWQRGKLSLV